MVSDFAKADAGMEAMAARVAEPERNLRRSMRNMGDPAFHSPTVVISTDWINGRRSAASSQARARRREWQARVNILRLPYRRGFVAGLPKYYKVFLCCRIIGGSGARLPRAG